MAWMLFREPRDIGQKLLALYFALTLFNNPCFQIWGASLGDIFGVISAVVLILRVFMCPQRQFRLTEIAGLFLICAGTFAVHAFIIYLLYPNLNEGMIGVVRFILIAKVAVLGLNVLLFRKVFNELDDIDWLLNQIVNFAVVALICYFIQIGICFTGQLPYGTYIDAGFTGLPSFGSVSIERGHLGKFLTPLFPIFLLVWLRHRRKWPFIVFCIVSIINLSASSLFYFTCYALMTLWIFRRKLFNLQGLLWVSIVLTAIISVTITFYGAFAGVALKIIDLGIKGNDEGGRGIGLLFNYLSHYPLGISYGGSTLRTGPGLDEINSGIFAFITQFSFFSIPLICLMIFIGGRIAQRSRYIITPYFRSILIMGSVMLPVIFSADLLWFVPTIWLPVILCEQMSFMQRIKPFIGF